MTRVESQSSPRPTLAPDGPALLSALVVGALTYVVAWLAGWPLMRFIPAVGDDFGRFAFGPGPEPMAMSYYGYLAGALLAFGATYGLVRLSGLGRRARPATVSGLCRLAMAVVVLSLSAIAVVELLSWGSVETPAEGGPGR